VVAPGHGGRAGPPPRTPDPATPQREGGRHDGATVLQPRRRRPGRGQGSNARRRARARL